jgi:hypothetical protein
MITQSYFEELIKELFTEYLSKVKASERKDFVAALVDELKANDVEFEDDSMYPDLDSLEEEDV